MIEKVESNKNVEQEEVLLSPKREKVLDLDVERTWDRKMDDINFTSGLEAEKGGRGG